MSKHIKKMIQSIQYDLDYLIYMFNRIIYINKQNITEYNWALDIIFDNKKKFVFWSHHDVYDFWDFFQSIKDDYSYVSKLFDEQFIDKQNFDRLSSIFDVTIKTCDMYKILFNILSLITFGVSKIFLNRKYC